MPQPVAGLQPKQINILNGNPSTVDQDPVEVWTTNNDKVKWACPGEDWLVVFEGPSPFERDYFDSAHPGNTQIVGKGGGTEYKYTVYVDGKRGKDPIIRIMP